MNSISLVVLSLSISSIVANVNLCGQYYSYDTSQTGCECEDIKRNEIVAISLKCHGHSYVPHFFPNVHYQLIEFESCLQDLQIGDKTFADLNINTLRFRHCNLFGLNEESFAKINQLEKFSIENGTIHSLATSTGNFQEIFQADSFQTLKSLTLKNVHYHQTHKHDKKFNFELLIDRLRNLHRLELMNFYLDNYRHDRTNQTGRFLTYLKLINTHQTSLIPIEYLSALESLILVHLPDIFRHQPLISSLKHLTKLKYIDFSQNQLTQIENLRSSSIDQIDLTSNRIENIDEFTFEHVPQLKTLTLTGNPLKSIDRNAFCGVESLKRLYLSSQMNSQVSPLDNCLLIDYPLLDIKQDSLSKFQCNCRLVHVFDLKRRQSPSINRLLKGNEHCLVTNETLDQAKNQQQLNQHFNLPLYIYELESYLNCSSNDQCPALCRERKKQPTTITSTLFTSTAAGKSHSKKSSASSSIVVSFSSTFFFLLLFAFLYL